MTSKPSAVQSMIHQIANALFDDDMKAFNTKIDWDEASSEDQKEWCRGARVALTALLNPTDAMIERGLTANNLGPYEANFDLAYRFRAMIQAALNEEKA